MTAENIHMALAQTLGQTHFDAHKGNKIKRRNVIDTSLASTMYRGYYRSDDSIGCLGGLMFPLELKSSFIFFQSL